MVYKSQHEKTATSPFEFVSDQAPHQRDCFTLAQAKRRFVVPDPAIRIMGIPDFIKLRKFIL